MKCKQQYQISDENTFGSLQSLAVIASRLHTTVPATSDQFVNTGVEERRHWWKMNLSAL